MLVRIVGDVDDIQSLREWMSHDDEFRGLVKPAVTNIPGTMSPVTDLVLMLSTAGASATAGALASTVSTWLATRPSVRHEEHSDFELEVTRPDGTRLRVSGLRVRDPESVRRLINDALNGGMAGDDSPRP